MLTRAFFPDTVTTEWLILELVLAGVCVVVMAIMLTRLADRFAEEWQLGKAFVGMLLLATVTSLPEVVAGATAGAIGAVDMGFGAVYGSCSFNIVIIVIMNLFLAGGGSVLRVAGQSQILSGSFGIIMIAFSLSAIVTVGRYDSQPAVQQLVEWVTMIAIVITYVHFMWLSQRFERQQAAETPIIFAPRRSTGLLVQLGLVSACTVASAWWLTSTGDVLADHPIEALGRPLGRTLVGMCFLAAATSLPEITTSVTAMRMNNLQMALGNVFGSNMFNMLVFPVIKVATLASGDPLMMAGEDFSANSNVAAGLLAILLTGVAVMGITYRTQRRVFRLGVDSVALLVLYVVGMIVVLSGQPSR